MKLLLKLKLLALKLIAPVIIMADSSTDASERILIFARSSAILGGFVFAGNIFHSWYITNQKFTWAVMVVIIINAGLGGVMHFGKGKFNWEVLLIKTVRMLLVVWLTYLTLELIIGFAGTGTVVNGVRAALQISTLLYPGAKVLKNIFIISNGEHPPKWIMTKVYNFQENGDLREFLDVKNPTENKDQQQENN